MDGWVKLHRQIAENELWLSERFTRAQAWVDMIILAGHKGKTIFIRGNEIRLERGELGFSIKSLSGRWKWNERTVNKFLTWLENREMIQCRKTFITTIISIKKYDLYQGSTEQNTEQSTERSKSRIHTNKKEKKDKNEKNSERDDFIDLIPSELNSEEFQDTWLRWIVYRAEIKKKITRSTAQQHFKKLMEFKNNDMNPVDVINQSIEKSWTGLFPLKQNGTTYQQPQQNGGVLVL